MHELFKKGYKYIDVEEAEKVIKKIFEKDESQKPTNESHIISEKPLLKIS